MSASMRPTRRPWRASAAARFTETLDLPTPPLPEETASTLPRCGNSTGVGGGGTGGGGGGGGFPGARDLPPPPLRGGAGGPLPGGGNSAGGGGGGKGGAGGEPGGGARAPRGGASARHGDLHARDPGDRLDRLARVTREGARVLGGEQEGERHLSPVVHGEVLDHAGGDDVLGHAGGLDSREGALDAGAQRVGRGHARECTRAEAGGST